MSAGFFGQGGFGQSAGFGGLAGGALGFAGTGLSAGLSIAEGKKARDFQKKVMKRRYQWMASDLEKAGINRILAPSIGAGGASAPVANVPDFGASLARAGEAGSKIQKTDAEKALIGKQLDVAAATNARLLEDTKGLRSKRLAMERDPNNLLFDSEGFTNMLNWPGHVSQRVQGDAKDSDNWVMKQLQRAFRSMFVPDQVNTGSVVPPNNRPPDSSFIPGKLSRDW